MQSTVSRLTWGRPRRLLNSSAGRGSNHRAAGGPVRMLPAAQYSRRTPSHPPFRHSHSLSPTAPLTAHPFSRPDTHILHRHHNRPASFILARRRPHGRWASLTPGHSPSLPFALSSQGSGGRGRSLLLLLVMADARQSCCQLLACTAIVGPRYIGTPIWQQWLSPCCTC